MCLGNVKYMADMFDIDDNTSDAIYETIIVDNFENERMMSVNGEDISTSAIFEVTREEALNEV